MPSKTEEYLALAQRTANGLTRYWESWTDYLTTASRLYKYPFADQLMIYAQLPDATACASFDIWNNRIDNRYQERAVANGSLMMCEVQGAKEDFIRRWNTIFKEYPDVFEDSDCRKIIHDLTEDAVQYLLKIKEKTL